MSVDAHPQLGYRIDAPGHGRFRVSADGSLIECAPALGPPWRWHRPFLAQALPLAASLRGMEVLHASAVVTGGSAIAFTGHSGAGKTSLAIHLVDQGASLLADDVVALSVQPHGLAAHPGVRFANVDEDQIKAIPLERRGGFGDVIGCSGKLHILVNDLATQATPLRALYFLERRGTVAELEFEALSPDPRRILGATFMPHIVAPARLRAQLAVSSLIAADVAMFSLRVPPSLSAAALAREVRAHASRISVPNSPGERL